MSSRLEFMIEVWLNRFLEGAIGDDEAWFKVKSKVWLGYYREVACGAA
jgi:hypothetical protein